MNTSSCLTNYSLGSGSTPAESSTSDGQADISSSPNPVLGSFLFVVVVVTVLANLFVLVSFAYEKKLRTTFSILIGNLAVADLIVAVIPMNFDTIKILYGYWPLGKVWCGIWAAVDYVAVMASNVSLIVISIDRLWSIKWSIHYRRNNTTKKAVIIVTFVWLFTFLFGVYPTISSLAFKSHDRQCDFVPAESPPYIIALALIFNHLPCFLIVIIYFIVFLEIRKLVRTRPQDKFKNPSTGTSSGREQANEPAKMIAKSCSVNKTDHTVGEKQMPGEAVDNSEDTTASTSTSSSEKIEKPMATAPSSVHINQASRTAAPPSRRKGESNDKSNARSDRERKTFVTLSYLVIAYVVCWQPFQVIHDMGFIRPEIVSQEAFNALFWMSFVNSTLNPFLYAFSSSRT